jgi:hypothetical protein
LETIASGICSNETLKLEDVMVTATFNNNYNNKYIVRKDFFLRPYSRKLGLIESRKKIYKNGITTVITDIITIVIMNITENFAGSHCACPSRGSAGRKNASLLLSNTCSYVYRIGTYDS